MQRQILFSMFVTLCLIVFFDQNVSFSSEKQLRILIIGAHPDDAEKAGGTASKYIALGHEVPSSEEERRVWLAKNRKAYSEAIANKYRNKLIELYGRERGSKIRYAEAFEISEYGRSLPKEKIMVYFPFFK